MEEIKDILKLLEKELKIEVKDLVLTENCLKVQTKLNELIPS